MSNRTNIHLLVKGCPSLGAATLVAQAFAEEDDYGRDALTALGQTLLTGEVISVDDIHVGESGDYFRKVLAVMTDIGVDFAVQVWEDPYSDLGLIHWHTPGLPNFQGDCSTEGDVMLAGQQVTDSLQLLDEGGTTLEGFKVWVIARSGSAHIEAWRA